MSPAHILMVDDEDLLLTMGETILSAYGYRVLTANSGQKALDLLSKSDIAVDLMITDLVKIAHDLKLEVHPYAFRADALPDYATSLEDLLRIFLEQAGVDGLFTDHPDRAAAFVRRLDGNR